MLQKSSKAEVDEIRRILAANVRRARQALGLTLEVASGRAGMHWRHWQKIEAAEVNATLETVVRLAGALETKPHTLLLPSALALSAKERAERLVDELLAHPALRAQLMQLIAPWIQGTIS